MIKINLVNPILVLSIFLLNGCYYSVKPVGNQAGRNVTIEDFSGYVWSPVRYTLRKGEKLIKHDKKLTYMMCFDRVTGVLEDVEAEDDIVDQIAAPMKFWNRENPDLKFFKNLKVFWFLKPGYNCIESEADGYKIQGADDE